MNQIIKRFLGIIGIIILEYCNPFLIYNYFKYGSLENYYSYVFKNNKKINIVKKNSSDNEYMKCINYNIQGGFDSFYNYTINNQIYDLNSNNADFIFLQGVSNTEQFNYIRASLNYDYSFYSSGLAVLSKYKIEINNIYFDNLNFYKCNNFLYIEALVDNQKIYFLNVQLTRDITCFKQLREIREMMRCIHIKLDKFKDKLIILGDFNSTIDFNEIYTNQLGIKSELKTYPSFYPIFSSAKTYYRNIQLKSVSVKDVYYSDYKPLEILFKL